MPKVKSRLPVAPGEKPLFVRRPVPPPVLSSAQIRGARALLGITQAEMAERLGVGLRTLAGWEAGLQRCSGEMCAQVLASFYAIGVIFPSGGAGVEGKFKDGGRKKPTGDSVQLMSPGEAWVTDEVMDEPAPAPAARKTKR